MRRTAKRVAVAIGACGILLAASELPAGADIVIDMGRGPVSVHVPPSYDPEVPAPLICNLHGYGSNGAWQESYFRFLPLAEEYGFLYFCPDGTVDQQGYSFWNATDACCDFYGSGVDDSGYLLALVDEIKAQLSVDARRVYFTGLSNGAFMCYRMACDHAETIAAIACLAGVTFADSADCSPASPVHVLHIHGTADDVVLYDGGSFGGPPYPGAVATVEQWARFGGCSDDGILTPPPLDLDAGIPGDETNVFRYDIDCDPDGSAELWSIVGGWHVPPLTEEFSPLVIEFLLAHPKSDPAMTDDEPGTTAPSAGSVLLPATPSPCDPGTRLRYRLSEASPVILTIHDLTGRAVRTLLDGEVQDAGDHELEWDGCGARGEPLPSGVYFVNLEVGRKTTCRKLVLTR